MTYLRNERFTRYSLYLALFACLAETSRALEVPPGGVDLTGGAPVEAFIGQADGTAETIASGGQVIDVRRPDEARPFIALISMPCLGGAITKADRVLAIIRARVTEAESGLAVAKLQFGEPPYRAVSPTVELTISRDWRDYPVLFVADDGISKGKAKVVLLCGQKAQRLEVASVRVLRYPSDTEVALFPRIARTYAGRELDAPWRRAALERIERERKADLRVTVSGTNGQPLKNAHVRLTLRRHAFGFGSATPVKWYLDQTEDGRRWREIVDTYFSAVVFENDLKDFEWGAALTPERRAARNADLDQALAWLAARHIAVRGHYLMQVATPSNLSNVKDEAAIREHFLRATRERLACVRDRVCEWDVINHPVAWSGADMLNKRPGLELLDREVLALARTLTKLPLLVNEDQLFRPGHQSDGTFDYLKALIAAGYPVDGLGNQAHFHESYLPSPAELMKVTDHFATLVPRQVITEFDIVTCNDEELAADYTRDLLITCFSHAAYSGFLWWGFWEGAHWKPEAASWNRDWTPRKRSDVIREWLGVRWRTDVTVTTDANGTAAWRGFPGWYEVQADAQPLPMVEAKR